MRFRSLTCCRNRRQSRSFMPENDVARVARPGATVFIKPKRARPFFGRHPWVLDSAILRVDGNPDSGAIVDVVTHDGSFIARGLWNASSRIRVRLYSFMQDQSLDEIFWDTRIENAVRLRKNSTFFPRKLPAVSLTARAMISLVSLLINMAPTLLYR